MNRKLIRTTIIAALILLPAISAFAGGARMPGIALFEQSASSLLVAMDWNRVSKPENGVWGLYRFDKEHKTYTLVKKLAPQEEAFVDSNLSPPLDKYFYNIEKVKLGEELNTTMPIRIKDTGVAIQPYSPPVTVTRNEPAVAPKTESKPYRPSVPTDFSSAGQEGIYVGIIGFSGTVNDITRNPDGGPTLVRLDKLGRNTLQDYLDHGYVPAKSKGAALYYAEHKALANLSNMEQSKTLPNKIDSVTIITITDGNDTSSTDAAFTPLEGRDFRHNDSTTDYRNFISQQLRDRTVGGSKITAWAVGIPDRDGFTGTLGSAAFGPEYTVKFEGASTVKEKLLSIADDINIYTPRVNLTLSMPAYPVNTLLRITFDDVENPLDSKYYIDARIGWNGSTGNYALERLTPNGIKLLSRQSVDGKRNNETDVNYTLTFRAESIEKYDVQQWYMKPGEDSLLGWMRNNELDVSSTTDFMYERKSAIVYLVLDCGTALTEKEINGVRTAAGAFLDRLYSYFSYGESQVLRPPIVQAYTANRQKTPQKSTYWVQIGAYEDINHARRIGRDFSRTGIGGTEIFKSNVKGVLYYRLRVGPYAGMAEAQKVLSKIKNYSSAYRDSFIINE